MDQTWTAIGLVLTFLMSGAACISLGISAYAFHRMAQKVQVLVEQLDVRSEAKMLTDSAAAHAQLQRGHVKMTESLIVAVTDLEKAVNGFRGVVFPGDAGAVGVTEPDPKMANVHHLAERLQKLGFPRRDAEERAIARMLGDEEVELEFS